MWMKRNSLNYIIRASGTSISYGQAFITNSFCVTIWELVGGPKE